MFILDPWFVQNARVGPNRWRFLVQTLLDLDNGFKKIGSRLFILKEKPLEIFEKLFNDWNVEKLTFETDNEPYSKERDELVTKLAEKHSVTVSTKVSHTLFDLEKYRLKISYFSTVCENIIPFLYRVFKANGSRPPLTYIKFLSVIDKLGTPDAPLDAPGMLPDSCRTSSSTPPNITPPTFQLSNPSYHRKPP